MSRILWHGVAPWHPTGYGQQAAIWTRKLRDAGHDIAIGAQGGNNNCVISKWEDIDVYPSTLELEAVTLVTHHTIKHFKPDLIITNYDCWQMGPGVIFKPYKTLAWIPIDTDIFQAGPNARRTGGVAYGDRLWLSQSDAKPIAMSKHGQRMLKEAGYAAPMIPHGIDTRQAWTPPEDRGKVKQDWNLDPDTFLVVLSGTNIDPHRKSFSEQLTAFAKFHYKHPNSAMIIHTQMHTPNSLNIPDLIDGRGLSFPTVQIIDQGFMYTGMFPQPALRDLYGAADVVMAASHGEGFGLAAVEAQACGTPVILARGHTGPELVGPGWLVRTQEFWNWTHKADWHIPLIPDLVKALEQAYQSRGAKRAAARVFAEGFDTEIVWPMWEKLLAEHGISAA